MNLKIRKIIITTINIGIISMLLFITAVHFTVKGIPFQQSSFFIKLEPTLGLEDPKKMEYQDLYSGEKATVYIEEENVVVNQSLQVRRSVEIHESSGELFKYLLLGEQSQQGKAFTGSLVSEDGVVLWKGSYDLEVSRITSSFFAEGLDFQGKLAGIVRESKLHGEPLRSLLDLGLHHVQPFTQGRVHYLVLAWGFYLAALLSVFFLPWAYRSWGPSGDQERQIKRLKIIALAVFLLLMAVNVSRLMEPVSTFTFNRIG